MLTDTGEAHKTLVGFGIPKELIDAAAAAGVDWKTLLQWVITYGLPFILAFFKLPPLPLPVPLHLPPLPPAPSAPSPVKL